MAQGIFAQENTAVRTTWQLSLGAFVKCKYQEWFCKNHAIATDETRTTRPVLFIQNFKKPKLMNKASETIQISLIALIFAATAASFIHIVLQACPSWNTSISSCLRTWSLRSTQRVSTGCKNKAQETQTVTRSFTEHVQR